MATLEELFAQFSERELMQPMTTAPSPWRYRNKMEYSFSQDKAGNHYLGLYRSRGRNRVENLETCHLVPEWFSEALGIARVWWKESGLKAYHPHKNTGHLRTLTLREATFTGQRLAMLTVSGNPEDALTKRDIASFKEAMTAMAPNISLFLRIHQAIKGQPTQFFEHHLSGPDHILEELTVAGRVYRFKISPSAFFQPNSVTAQHLYTKALSLLELKPTDTLYDLYCGTGTLSILFGPKVTKVVGIELNPYAICDARENAKLNELTNIEFICSDVAAYLQERKDQAPPDACIIDPPRAGLDDKALQVILALRPKQLLYISCNPKTQARDLEALLEIYTLQVLQPIDQFPHTPHVENIALLKIKD